MQFSVICGNNWTIGELLAWLGTTLALNLLQQVENLEKNTLRWKAQVDVGAYFAKHSSQDDLRNYHLHADQFILELLSSLAIGAGIVLPEGTARRQALIGPNGLMYHAAHLPEHQEFTQGILNLAVKYFEHLFALEEYKDAGNILNDICFALARRGQRKMAENMLALVATKTKGLANLAARINLATLLREENQIAAAMNLYWRTLPGLIRLRAFFQLAQALTELAAVYRQSGNLWMSAVVLEFSIIVNGLLKSGKSAAIAHSQLSSTYRYLHLYSHALRHSRLAVNHFRQTNDFLNLGRSLLTQGNIFFNQSKSEAANACFDESLAIGQKIADPQAQIGSISGKARVLLQLKQYDEAQSLLQEAISLRERHNDHNIGIEYQNMGALHENKGELALALGWYQKALDQFEKYMHPEAARCRNNIAKLEARYRAR